MKFVLIIVVTVIVIAACSTDTESLEPVDAKSPPVDAIEKKIHSRPFNIQENYTGFCKVDGRVESKYSGYTASGYINTSDKKGALTEWRIEVTGATQIELAWRYALASDEISATLSLNSDKKATIVFVSTEDESHWSESKITLSLKIPGVYSIRLEATSDRGLPNIDKLRVSGQHAKLASCDGSPIVEMTPNPRCIAGATFRNESIDCGGARMGLSCGGNREGQTKVLILRNASVKNLIIAADGGSDGIHCKTGECVLENVIWEDICEDAATLSEKARSMTIRGGWAYNSTGGVGGPPDKIFQHNADRDSTLVVTDNFTAKGINGKLWRSCGDCTFNTGPRHVVINNVTIEGEMKTIAVPNVNEEYGDTVTISSLKIENYTQGKPMICRAALGWQKGQKQPKPHLLKERWNTKNCQVDPSDILPF